MIYPFNQKEGPAMAASNSKSLEELDEYFSFEADGKTYVMPLKTKDVMNPGWVRSNRRREQTDYLMTLIENLCGVSDDPKAPKPSKDEEKVGTEVLAALDKLSWPDHQAVQKALMEHLGATVGE